MLLTIDGQPISEIGAWSLGEWSTNMQGPEELAWQMRAGAPDPRLRPSLLVELIDGGTVVWSGTSERPARGTGQMSARGHAAAAYETPALTAGGASTMVADTAIDAAISRGALLWRRPDSVSSTAVSTDTLGETPTIGELLDAVADEAGQWWRVGANRVVELYARPSTPRWLVTAGAGTLDVVEGDYASKLFGRRRTSTGGYATESVEDADATALTGYREDLVDLTPLGYTTQAKAEAILAGMLSKGRGRLKFANGVRGSRFEILNLGGVPAHLPAVSGGQLARFMVQHDETRYLQGRGYVDELIGRVVHPEGESSAVELQPLGLARGADFRDAVAFMASRRKRDRK